ncbi:MAG: Flp pilus assembly complex ATPase component TadA [Elusimicrobia bacterium]|nr:Flp pilus assembly complex ATPase component TadA [Elusimicrobiota bacterium]
MAETPTPQQQPGKEIESAPVVKMINMILQRAIKLGASDIHLEPFEKTTRIRFRIDGVLHNQKSPPKTIYNQLVSRIKVMSQLDLAEKRLPQDGRIKLRFGKKPIDLRVSTMPSAFGEKVVMRILDSSSLCLDLKMLGFEERDLAIFEKCISSPNGIILITGPTGSGKTTTLYSTLTTLNHPDVNINTMEDPVEYLLKGIIQVQAKPEIGLTFANGLRTFMRQDPDIIMVGEIRDKETAEIAINAALTGHLVFSTLHTNDAPTAVTRLDNMGVEPFLISSTIVMSAAQRLVRKVCKDCKESYEIEAETLMPYGLEPEEIDNQSVITLYKGAGCDTCGGTGYKGRLACYEIMECTREIKELINKRAPSHEIKSVAMEQGMRTLRKAALKKVIDGVTSVDEMLRVTARDTG